MPAISGRRSVEIMASRPGRNWRMTVVAGCMTPTIALAGCSPSSHHSTSQGVSTPAATSAASTPPATSGIGIGTDYCAFVIKVNTDAGTMVDKTFIPTDKWSRTQVASLVDFTLSHRTEFLDITPPDLRASVETEMQWMQAIKAAGYDLTADGPAGTADAMGKITNYQIEACGISYG
ncbi:MAG TPA: hypothetical protein VKB69_01525 [Micromonosporaceae bacterium]|nr:hypothetical protein [Micromonosporaceae bacterium]